MHFLLFSLPSFRPLFYCALCPFYDIYLFILCQFALPFGSLSFVLFIFLKNFLGYSSLLLFYSVWLFHFYFYSFFSSSYPSPLQPSTIVFLYHSIILLMHMIHSLSFLFFNLTSLYWDLLLFCLYLPLPPSLFPFFSPSLFDSCVSSEIFFFSFYGKKIENISKGLDKVVEHTWWCNFFFFFWQMSV